MAKPSRNPLPPVNVTPLVDVLLILLVILMLAMPLYVKRLPVELPTTSLAGTPTPVKALPLALQKDNSVWLRDSQMSLETVLTQVGPQVTVELSVDKDVTYDMMAKLLASLQSKHPKEIVLITR